MQNVAMPRINPEILVFARETAGLSLEVAAKKMGWANTNGLVALEAGERDPTQKQLLKMSEKYHKPLLMFYLEKPPAPADTGEDFRTLPEGHEQEAQPILKTLLRDVVARQKMVVSALEEINEAVQLPFVGSVPPSIDAANFIALITEALGFSVHDFRLKRGADAAFGALREAVEKIGVYVLLAGNLGSHHTNIPVPEFRGFALADPVAPFIVINENDSKAAWAFTLLHELAHIWLGQTGTSGYRGQQDVERLCDKVASGFLLPVEEVMQLTPFVGLAVPQLVERISGFANERNISRKMVAYNLAEQEQISWEVYGAISQTLDAERRAIKQARDSSSGPSYYVVRGHRLGGKLISAVNEFVSKGALTHSKAGTVLGVKPNNVQRLFDSRELA